MLDYAGRDMRGIGEKGPQKAHCAELQGKSQPIVIAAADREKGAVGVIEVEIAGQLVGRRFTAVASVALCLLVTEKIDGHRRFMRASATSV